MFKSMMIVLRTMSNATTADAHQRLDQDTLDDSSRVHGTKRFQRGCSGELLDAQLRWLLISRRSDAENGPFN